MVEYKLILFVTGNSRKSELARQALDELCEQHLKGRCQKAIIDVLESPDLAEEFRVMATPTLIRQQPPPVRRIIGDLGNSQRLLEILEITGKTAFAHTGQDKHETH